MKFNRILTMNLILKIATLEVKLLLNVCLKTRHSFNTTEELKSYFVCLAAWCLFREKTWSCSSKLCLTRRLCLKLHWVNHPSLSAATGGKRGGYDTVKSTILVHVKFTHWHKIHSQYSFCQNRTQNPNQQCSTQTATRPGRSEPYRRNSN